MDTQTRRLYGTLVTHDGHYLPYVPLHRRTEEMITAAVSQNHHLLAHIPNDLRKGGLAIVATQEDGRALQWVPKRLLCEETVTAAATSSNPYIALHYVLAHCHALKVSMAAVRKNGMVCRTILDLFYHPEEGGAAAVPRNDPVVHGIAGLVAAAVQQNGHALQYVPEHLRSAEVVAAAVRQQGRALQWVPSRLRTAELAMAAVRQDGAAILWVPAGLHTAEVATVAVRRNGLVLEHALLLKRCCVCISPKFKYRISNPHPAAGDYMHGNLGA